jgi:hypothetical protein
MTAITAYFYAWCNSLDRLAGAKSAEAKAVGLAVFDPADPLGSALVIRKTDEIPYRSLSAQQRRELPPVYVRLGERMAFTRRKRLAWAARFQAHDVVRLQLASLSPLPASDTAFAVASVVRVLSRTGNPTAQAEAIVRIADRRAIEKLSNALKAEGVRIAGMDSDWPDHPAAPLDLMLGRRRFALPGSFSRLAMLSLGGLALVAITAQSLLALNPPPAPPASRTEVVALPPAVEVADLALLARTLNDQEWLESIEANARDIILRGFATDTAGLSARLSEAGFQNVRIVESARDDAGRDRFQISLTRPLAPASREVAP